MKTTHPLQRKRCAAARAAYMPWVLLAVLALAGCKDPGGMPRSPRNLVPGKSLLQLTVPGAPLPMLSITADVASGCAPQTPVRASVQWNVASLTPAHVFIAYMTPGSVWQLWQVGNNAGSAVTDAWVTPGMTFAVVDQSKRKVLAQAAYDWNAACGK